MSVTGGAAMASEGERGLRWVRPARRTLIGLVLTAVATHLPGLFAAVAIGVAWHAHAYRRALDRVLPTIDPAAEEATRLARRRRAQLVQIRTSATVLATMNIVAMMMPSWVQGAVLTATLVGYIAWFGEASALNRNLAELGVPRLATETSRTRQALRSWGLETACLRSDGQHNLPVLHVMVMCLLSVATLVAIGGPTVSASVGAQPPLSVRALLTYMNLSPATGPKETAQPLSSDPDPAAVTDDPGAVSTPTALASSPCPDVAAVHRTLSTGVPAGVGDALYQAWFSVGGRVIGCPENPPSQLGPLTIAELTGGQDTPVRLVYGLGHASVVFSDMYSLLDQVSGQTGWIGDRLRWGLGTQQLVHLRNGSCSLAQRYRRDPPTLLPPSVTSVALTIADRTGAVPRLLSQPVVPGGRQYAFALIAADALHHARTIDNVQVLYRAGRAVVSVTGDLASDLSSCPSSQLRLPVVSAALEQALQTKG